MATSGGGTGTPVSVSLPAVPYDPYEAGGDYGNCAVPLHRYAQLISYDECAFWGVRYDGQEERECNSLWTEIQRSAVAVALAEAQADIEGVVGYPLCPTWVGGDGDLTGRWSDVQSVEGVYMTRYGYVITPGIRAESTIASGVTVNYGATDPATVGPVATSVTDPSEVWVFYPNSTRRIYPSSITISGGNLTLRIPKCRMVKPDLLNNEDGVREEIVSNFLETVDIRRVYTDPSTQAVLTTSHICGEVCVSEGCQVETQTACMLVRNNRLGFIRVYPATYSDGSWTVTTTHCPKVYDQVRLYYQAGIRSIPPNLEMAIVRLAHTKLGESPCDCGVITTMWRRDREAPRGGLTRTLLNAPFGIMEGARHAYNVALRYKLYRGGIAQ